MRNNQSDEKFMQKALDLSKECMQSDDVPVGALIVRHGEILSVGKNSREKSTDATSHAEIEAIREACRALGGWHLTDCELYVTLEPCPMCAGAIINSRIDTVIIGTEEPKSGAFGSLFNICDFDVNHKPEIIKGVLREECSQMLKDFFKEKRERGNRR